MKASEWDSLFLLPILVLAFMAIILGPAVLQRGPSAEEGEAPPRVTAVCLDCHDGYDTDLALSPHRVAAELPEGAEARVTCTDCHNGDTRHYEDDPDDYPMSRPDELGAAAEAQVCASCHQNAHQQNMNEQNIHFESGISCSGCHQMHGSSEQGLLHSAEIELCISCHSSVEGQFAQPYHHPVGEGIMKCSECHHTLDETANELSWNGTNAACVTCHTEFEGPFPYEHQATLDYSPEEGGCIACHSPHGSSQPRMLNQPYEAPHFQLCTQCHSVPPGHNQNLQHGDTFAGVSCNECHSDIHGSFTNRNFLSQTLEAQGCFTAGCHR